MRVVVATGGDIGTHVTRPQGPDQLTPELVGAKAQAQHGDAQDAVVRQRHLVLPEGIVDGCESLRVLNAVNLHDERVVLPPGVEIDAAVGQRADDLPFGGWDANAPTERAHVELAEGVADPLGAITWLARNPEAVGACARAETKGMRGALVRRAQSRNL